MNKKIFSLLAILSIAALLTFFNVPLASSQGLTVVASEFKGDLPANDPAAARPVTRDTDRGIRFYDWAYTSNHILFIQDKGGDENWRLYSVDLDTGDTKDLTPLEGVQARFQEISPQFPAEILVALNDRDPRLHDLYRINIATGERRLVQKNEGFAGFVTDRDYRARLAVRVLPDGVSAEVRRGSWPGLPLFQFLCEAGKVPDSEAIWLWKMTWSKTSPSSSLSLALSRWSMVSRTS